MTEEKHEHMRTGGEKPGKSPEISRVQSQATSGVSAGLENKKVAKSPAQILFEKIYTGRHITHSLVNEEQIVAIRFLIPSIDDGARMGFQDPNHYAKIVSKVIKAIFKKDFDVPMYCGGTDILDGDFKETLKSGNGFPDRKIVFNFKDTGGYIEIIGQDAIKGSMGQVTVQVNHDDYCKKGMRLMDIRKMGEGVEGIDVYGERIHQFIGCGHGIDIQETPISVRYFSQIDGFVKIKEIDKHGMTVPQYISMSNNFSAGDIDNKILKIPVEPYNINIKATGEICSGTCMRVTGNVRCKIMNYPEEVTTTGGFISVLKEIRGAKVRGPFISLRNEQHPTSLFGDNTLFTDVADLYHTIFRGGVTTIHIGKDLFELKRKTHEKILSSENKIAEQERDFKKRVIAMMKGIKEDYTLMMELKRLSPNKREVFRSSLFKIKSYLSPFKIQEIYDVLNKLYREDEIDPIYNYLRNYVDLFNIYKLNEDTKKMKTKQEMELGEINKKLKTSLFVNITGKVVGDSSGIVINYGFKKKSIKIHEEGKVAMYMKYNPETDEFDEGISKEMVEREIGEIRKNLSGVSR